MTNSNGPATLADIAKEDGQASAFPLTTDGTEDVVEWGMTLRDYFAGKALEGILPGVKADLQWYKSEFEKTGKDLADIVAGEAYELADAMLRARKP